MQVASKPMKISRCAPQFTSYNPCVSCKV